MPFSDEWDWVRLSYLMRSGHLQWMDVWQAHNEHRLLISNLVFLAIDRSIGWNTLAEELVGFVALVGAQVVAWGLIRKNIGSPTKQALAFAGTSGLLFSPAQYETFSMGFNLQFALCSLATLTLIAALTSRRSWPSSLVAWAAALFASFSTGQGLVLWAVGLTALVWQRRSVLEKSAWGASAILVGVLYFHGNSVAQSDVAGQLSNFHPGTIVRYALVFLGAPIAALGIYSEIPATIASVLAIATTVLVLTFASNRPTAPSKLPWLLCMEYAILTSVLVGLARAGEYVIIEASAPRYMTIAVFLYIGLLGLALSSEMRISSRLATVAATGIVAFFLVGGLLSAALGDIVWGKHIAEYRRITAKLAEGRFSGSAKIYPNEAMLRFFIHEACLVHDLPIRCPPEALGARRP